MRSNGMLGAGPRSARGSTCSRGPRSWGAILLTGLLGGAISTHLRVGDPLLTHVLFPSYVGALVWGGLVLRDDRLRALVARPRAGASAPAT